MKDEDDIEKVKPNDVDAKSPEKKPNVTRNYLFGAAAKTAATYFGGPAAGKAVDAALKTKVGKDALNRASTMISSSPVFKPVTFDSPVTREDEAGGEGESTETQQKQANPLGLPTFKDDNNKKKEDKEKTSITVSSVWKKLPLSMKMAIIGGISFVLFIILIASLIAAIPSVFLDYSDDTQSSLDVPSEYENYWREFCGDGQNGCTNEQIEAAKKLQSDQSAFYAKLDSLAKKYNLTLVQKYIVLSTVFFNLDIDAFSGDVFEIDDSDEIDFEGNVDGKNAYEREKDTLKELIKQFKVNTAFCKYSRAKEGTDETEEVEEVLRGPNDELFAFNFFDNVRFKLGMDPDTQGFAEAKKSCLEKEGASVIMKTSSDSEASIDGYFKYLRDSTFLDDRPQNKENYDEYARQNGLSTDISTWTEEDKVEVRSSIVEKIKEIVESHGDEIFEEGENGNPSTPGTPSNPSTPSGGTQLGTDMPYVPVTGSSYWWPIGSSTTTSKNGALFATGAPASTTITSNFGYRMLNGKRNLHNGLDIGAANKTNIIASMGGTVTKVYNGCASSNSWGCGGTYGNHIVITDAKGNTNIYAHIYKDTIRVSKGTVVSQGQVLAGVGSSGNSTGPHLHFVIKINGTAVNPLGYISASNSRPGNGG